MPDEVTYLAHESRAATPGTIRRLTPPRDDRFPIYVQEQGAYVQKRGDRLQVTKDGETVADVRLLDVLELNLFGNVQISTQTVRELCQRDIPVAYYSYGGWLSGITFGMGHKNVEL
ncbi:CRISPR-associated endonuclease Cas1, partial [Limnochorda sp.]|uniref:CRISPR-associated endonuclease Cas1 n=1 Tax=Limnochorda sp. TaxID=1940279 RepID=UPI0039C38A39